MRTTTRSGIIVLCLLFMATVASAQMGAGMRTPMPKGMFNPVVGAGAVYDITSSDGRKTTIEFSIVGKDSVNGKDAYWMEWTTNAMGGEMVMKVLTSFGESGGMTHVIMQMPGRPPMEMPSQMTSRMGSQNAPADIRNSSEDVGSETITVPAGTFACEHYRAKDGSGDTWVSTKVSPFGVVKHQGKDDTMVLTKQITDAKDKIVGTPQPFDPSAFMGQH
jgi:hypothetical protein